MCNFSRRKFILTTSSYLAGAALGGFFPNSGTKALNNDIPLSGHLWVYASKFPPDWDSTPILEQVFKDFKYAGLEGLEMMESNLRHDDVVARIGELIEKYELPVTGSSYYGDMWDSSQHRHIIEDVEIVLERLHKLGGSTFGTTVGDAGHIKTEAELDAQARLLKKIIKICDKNDIQPNLHNHTFEIENDLHDLKGTMERVPEIKLGPDLGWLARAGIDPAWFICKYGHRMVYMHIRDVDANENWTKTVGEGVTDFSAITSALNDVEFDGRAAIELAFEEPPDGSVREYWKKSREYVKEIFRW